jgi:hypothetical protein
MLEYGVPRKPELSISVYRDNAEEPSPPSIAIQPNSLSRLPSFKPLPPMPESSPLRTSFLDFSLCSAPLSPESQLEATPPTIPSSISPQQSRKALTQDQPKCDKSISRKIHDDPFFIPAFQHPNSPYVPWAPPIRRRIIRPPTAGSHVSVLTSCYSRPISRSGARAPEPAETPEPVQFLAPPSKGWKQFRQTISNGINRVAVHFRALKRPFSAKRPASPFTTTCHTPSISHEDTFLAANYSSSPNSPVAVLTGRRLFMPSTASLVSSDSATLAAWLAARQRASQDERDYDPTSMMSLEEYERIGSWLDLSGNSKVDGKWVCGVPGCEAHTCHMLIHGGQVTTLDLAAVKENLTQGSSLRHNASSSQYGSSPQFRARARVSSGRRRPASTTPGAGSLPYASFTDQAERERCMPGGWTF